MKKTFSIIALWLTLACTVPAAACTERNGDSSPGETEINVEIDKNTSAKLVALVDIDAAEKNLLNRVVAKFNEIYPNIEIEVATSSDPISYIRSGDQADILSVIGENVSFYASQDILTDLDPYKEASGFDESLYYTSMMELGKDSISGRTYMMPRDYSRIVCFYNKEIFDICGVEYPADTEGAPWTWDKFLGTCKSIADSGKLPSGYVVTQAAMSYDILNWGIVSSYGVEGLLDDDYMLVSSDSEAYAAWQKGMQTAADVIASGYSLNSNTYSASDFQRGAAAMAFAAAPSSNSFIQGGIDYDILPFPSIGETPKAPAGTSGYAIAKSSKNKNAAWAFLAFLMSDEGQAALSEEGNIVPVKKSLAEDESAEWRNMKNGAGNSVNVEALISYQERDVIADWFGDLPALAQKAYATFYNTFLKNVCDGNKSFAQAYTVLEGNIKSYKQNYPEYFA